MATGESRNGSTKESWVVFDTPQGAEVGKLLKLTRHMAVFETHAPLGALQMSQVLPEFKILLREQTIYTGRAVIRGLINAGVAFVGEVSLDDRWLEAAPLAAAAAPDRVASGFQEFIQSWQKVYKVRPEFKVVVADLHSFLSDLRLWLDQLELGMQGNTPEARTAGDQGILSALEGPVVAAINLLHERFEAIGDTLDDEVRPAHQHFARRHLHPLFLCSPFGRRAYAKPLGHAGDYEMVNMIMRSPYEGPSLFAQVMNVWLLRQYPSAAHRNRIQILTERLSQEGLRRQVHQQPLRALSIGCGPAHEVQAFLRTSPLADAGEFELMDMSDEALEHVTRVLSELRARTGRRTRFRTSRRSVLGLLKDAARSHQGEGRESFDFIYCAGLFDYLTDPVCRQLLAVAYGWLAPGGLLLATNVDTYRPFRHMLEFLLEWHLNYRDRQQFAALVPDQVPPEHWSIISEATGTNLFLEIRKPETN